MKKMEREAVPSYEDGPGGEGETVERERDRERERERESMPHLTFAFMRSVVFGACSLARPSRALIYVRRCSGWCWCCACISWGEKNLERTECGSKKHPILLPSAIVL